MSVGEVELKKIAAQARRTDSDNPALSGILDEFQGQLNGLAPAAPLDLRDPSTPARRAQYTVRAKTDPTPTPLLTLRLPDAKDDDAPIVPPRTTSLQSSSPQNSPRVVWQPPPGGSPLRTRNHNSFGGLVQNGSAKDSARLRIMHGSSASISEPSLIPVGDVCESPHSIRLVSSPPVASALYRTSQHDLSVHDLTLARVSTSSHSPARGEDPEDMDTRGKELATRCWKEDEEFLGKEKIAEWLGGVCVLLLTLCSYTLTFSQTGDKQGSATLLHQLF
jgi:hypothetical protein